MFLVSVVGKIYPKNLCIHLGELTKVNAKVLGDLELHQAQAAPNHM